MGFARRLARKSARRAVRKTARVVTPRPVRKAAHPVRTVRYAATPRPVRQASRAIYSVRHPVRSAEAGVVSAALHPRRRARRRIGGFWDLFVRRRWRPVMPAPAPQVSRGTVSQASLTAGPPARRAASAERPSRARHAGDWEEAVRRQVGYGRRSRARRDSTASAAHQDPPF